MQCKVNIVNFSYGLCGLNGEMYSLALRLNACSTVRSAKKTHYCVIYVFSAIHCYPVNKNVSTDAVIRCVHKYNTIQ